MIKWLQARRGDTVFAPIPSGAAADKILAVLFHRSAVTIYAIYAIWGVVSFFGIIPTITFTRGSFFQEVFSAAIFITSAAAAIGALYFPRTGRTELFAGISTAALLLFYVLSLFYVGFFAQGHHLDQTKIPAAIYGASHLVIPVSRSIFIYLTLIRTSNEKRDRA